MITRVSTESQRSYERNSTSAQIEVPVLDGVSTWLKLRLDQGLDLRFCWAALSILFGLTWSIVRADVQGGFGITACMMVLFVFTVGIVQAAFEPR